MKAAQYAMLTSLAMLMVVQVFVESLKECGVDSSIASCDGDSDEIECCINHAGSGYCIPLTKEGENCTEAVFCPCVSGLECVDVRRQTILGKIFARGPKDLQCKRKR